MADAKLGTPQSQQTHEYDRSVLSASVLSASKASLTTDTASLGGMVVKSEHTSYDGFIILYTNVFDLVDKEFWIALADKGRCTVVLDSEQYDRKNQYALIGGQIFEGGSLFPCNITSRGFGDFQGGSYFADSNNAFTCRQCRPGHACKLREEICPAGTASNDNRTMCVPCAAGEFSSAPGAASCQKCPAGKYSTCGGSTSCLDCPTGKYSEAVGSTGCKICPAGQYSSTAASSGCTSCPAGQYSSRAGSSGCTSCPAGQYSSRAGSSGCTSCPAGQYSSRAESSGCTSCPAGQYSSTAGSDGCTNCPAGQYSSTAGSDGCTDCPAGQYSSTAGSDGCTNCPRGYTTTSPGRSACAGPPFCACATLGSQSKMDEKPCREHPTSGLIDQWAFIAFGNPNDIIKLSRNSISGYNLSMAPKPCSLKRIENIEKKNILGHTPGNGFDWPAKLGEGNRRVANLRFYRACPPTACEDWLRQTGRKRRQTCEAHRPEDGPSRRCGTPRARRNTPAATGEWRKGQVEVTTGGSSHKPARRRPADKWSSFFALDRKEPRQHPRRLSSLFRMALLTLYTDWSPKIERTGGIPWRIWLPDPQRPAIM
ncbi:hypothetical protein Bbelb_053640 [Branchiostoma belcheri]|nr:hypothetical protein Bbelb_053640 [Branchiostoma belcheri]